MPPPACPPPEELQAFSLGDVEGAAFECIARHLDGCPGCAALLQAFDQTRDELTDRLRGLRDADPATAAPVPDELVAAALQAAAPPGDPARELSLDAGRRYARQLGLGECRLGKFELQAELGAGSFGHVFRARDTELDR